METPRKGKTRKFKFPEPPKAFADFLRARPQLFHVPPQPPTLAQLCDLISVEANKLLAADCAAKQFTVDSIYPPSACGQVGAVTKPVDLVVVIDTSGSMAGEAENLNAAADAAIEAARQKCPSDLRVAWFGIEGTFPNTKFDTELRDYLNSLGVPDSDIEGRRVEDIGQPAQEDGAAAIEDISEHFDWRPDASKVIFYLGDEALEGGGFTDLADQQAATDAISAANGKVVVVHTYAGTGAEADPNVPGTIDEYGRVAKSTGGTAFVAPADLTRFQEILEEIICEGAGATCLPVRLPDIHPCFTLQWGDGPNDRIETDDVEVLCLTASNPYSNVTLKNVTAFLLVMSATGLPENLPDGTPSVVIKPYSMICFGDLPPCGLGKANGRSAVSREVVLISRGAREDTYYIFVVYCYSVEFALAFGSVFPIELVKS